MARIITMFILTIAFHPMASLEAFDKEFIGVNYKGFPQSDSEITADIELLSQHFSFIRTYMDIFTPQHAVVPIVDAHNKENPTRHIGVAVGVGLTPGDTKKSFEELDIAISQANQYPNTVKVIVVGNENLGNVSEADLIMFMDYVRENLKQPTSVAVTTCQTWGVWAGHPKLGDHVDFILANIYPYWDGAPINEWNQYFLQDYNKLKDTFPGKEIVIGETGWPSAGQQVMVDGHLTGIPSLANEEQYILEYAN